MKTRFALATAIIALAGPAAAFTGVDAFDTNGDGFATEAEIMAVFPDFDSTFFDDIDTNDDGRVSFAEMQETEAQNILGRYETATATPRDLGGIDVDGDGFASYAELAAAYPGLTELFYEDIDSNDDGRVAFDELYAPEAQTIVSRYEASTESDGFIGLAQLDASGDGFVDLAEVVGAYPSFDQTFFDDMDTNDDGRLSVAEVRSTTAQNIFARY